MPTLLGPQERVHGIEVGLQMLESAVMLLLDLVYVFFELSLRSVHLLLEKSSPILQVVTDVTH